jgi:hypothetical protein
LTITFLKQHTSLTLFLEQSSTSFEEIKHLVLSEKITSSEATAMFISTLARGEVKIALDCCRELGFISQENRKHLPQTLGDRLQIFAFIKKHQVREIE